MPGDEAENPSRSPLTAELSTADDRLRLSHWLPPRHGIAPHIRFGRRWFNTLWLLPIAAFLLLFVIAAAQSLRELPSVQAFISVYPGVSGSTPALTTGFPWWLRLQHFLNMFFMLFIIRAGIQILADHPRLYWRRDCTPGTEWFRFQKDVPKHRIWTSKDDAVTLPQWLGIPGLRHTIGLARWWHLSADLLWTVNGIAFYVLLFTTNQWLRIVPLSWDVFPNSVSMAIQYASLDFPVEHLWTRFNALQQLTYFITLFVAAPISIVTGLLQGPAISNRLGWVGRIVNRQAARSIHFVSFTWFVFFILAHGALVFMTGLRKETNYMFAGVNNGSWSGFFIFLLAAAALVAAWAWVSPFTIRRARLVQQAGRLMVGWLKGLIEWFDPRSQLTEKDISPHFWANGTMPASAEFEALVAGDFRDYRLRIGGLVEAPRQF
jgi:thiosulfate reductase cytochrome b subunit